MERKIGEIFKFDGEWYQCVVATQGCRECSFRTRDYCTHHSECMSIKRSDERSVIFKKLKKVGEPYRYQGIGIIMVQEYILANTNYIWEYGQDIVVIDCQNGKVAIEIEQNKEDMEEKKQKLDDLVGLYSSAQITYKEFDKELKSLYTKQGEEDKPVLKSFNLEEAKEGKPVCTRDGRKARIICFDKMGVYPVIALVQKGGIELCHFYTGDGKCAEETNHDLMMLPEKKERWVNVYNADTTFYFVEGMVYDTKEEAIKHINPDNEIYTTTVKIEWEE